jgi:hypothetical protein
MLTSSSKAAAAADWPDGLAGAAAPTVAHSHANIAKSMLDEFNLPKLSRRRLAC